MGRELLYLDTARLGRMSPRARQAQADFARIAGEEGGSLLVERLLHHKTGPWLSHVEGPAPRLAGWRGIDGLKQSLRLLAGSRKDSPVLLAGRSVPLMRLAARLLCHPCRNVLTTDLSWSPYREILLATCQKANRALTVVPLARRVLEAGLSGEAVIDLLRSEYLRHGCDGLFLTAVSNRGVRLPVGRIVRALDRVREARFVVVDGAQAFCHVPADLADDHCDLYLAGSHKWLGAYHPLGIAFYGHPRSRPFVEATLARLIRTSEIDDPLLCFSSQLAEDRLDGTTETVNLTPLFACQGAVEDVTSGACPPVGISPHYLPNLNAVKDLAPSSGWRPLLPSLEFRSGIVLFQAERQQSRARPASDVRAAFYEQGVALTAYEEGLIRLSMPTHHWLPDELEHLRSALYSLA